MFHGYECFSFFLISKREEGRDGRDFCGSLFFGVGEEGVGMGCVHYE